MLSSNKSFFYFSILVFILPSNNVFCSFFHSVFFLPDPIVYILTYVCPGDDGRWNPGHHLQHQPRQDHEDPLERLLRLRQRAEEGGRDGGERGVGQGPGDLPPGYSAELPELQGQIKG